MPEQPTPAEPHDSPVTQNVSGGVTVQPGGDANISGDVVGRDKITTTTTVTNVGMTSEAVRRLVITVGVLVFATALCFFAFGAVTAAAALGAFARPVDSTLSAAHNFQNNLNQVAALSPRQPFQWAFEETDLSSYVRFVLGPQVGFDGRSRFLPSRQIAFQGPWSGVNNLPVMLITTLQTNSAPVYVLDRAYVQILPLGANLGWVPVPANTVQPLLDQINADLGSGFVARSVSYPNFTADGAPVGPLSLIGISIIGGTAP